MADRLTACFASSVTPAKAPTFAQVKRRTLSLKHCHPHSIQMYYGPYPPNATDARQGHWNQNHHSRTEQYLPAPAVDPDREPAIQRRTTAPVWTTLPHGITIGRTRSRHHNHLAITTAAPTGPITGTGRTQDHAHRRRPTQVRPTGMNVQVQGRKRRPKSKGRAHYRPLGPDKTLDPDTTRTRPRTTSHILHTPVADAADQSATATKDTDLPIKDTRQTHSTATSQVATTPASASAWERRQIPPPSHRRSQLMAKGTTNMTAAQKLSAQGHHGEHRGEGDREGEHRRQRHSSA